MRRLAFGDESRFGAAAGVYFGVLTLSNASGLDGELRIHVDVGRTAGTYSARHLGDARALLLFRSERELDYHHHDVPRQKELLRGAFDGSTSLAVVGAYVLAGELARAGGDHERAFPAYERAMAEHVRGSRAAALSAAKTLVPTSRLGVRGLVQGARLVSALPAGPSRALLRLTTKSARVHNSMTVDDYPLSPTVPGRG
ncbi:hypothetical protein ACH347_40065 [Saccharopolyspora sp. 5N102]|uniref:hypothetical protein n=1 Tax=Saccharopolyspora sp. 5N102 TaxID=3375155 RepID=UPI0037B44E07